MLTIRMAMEMLGKLKAPVIVSGRHRLQMGCLTNVKGWNMLACHIRCGQQRLTIS